MHLHTVAAGFGATVVGVDGFGWRPDLDAAFVVGGALDGEDRAVSLQLHPEFEPDYAKALIDGTVSVIFTASMGIGVMLAAVPVLLYQGAITLAAGSLQTLITDPMLAEVSGVGGVLIIAISLNMLKLTKIKLANLLPGLPLAVLLVWLGWF